MSVHIGINSVDPKHYSGWSGPLAACEADASDMVALAKSVGIESSVVLMTPDATRERVRSEIKKAAATVGPGDFFFLTYSGHGGQLPDLNDDDDEWDHMDETWCLYDGQLVDDEIFSLLAEFPAKARIFVLSDSCHSGSVLRDAAPTPERLGGVANRAMPKDVVIRTYRENQALYKPILEDSGVRNAKANVKACALLISGCQDNELSRDGTFNGLFTGTLLQVWNKGAYKGSYVDFHASIRAKMPKDQQPNLYQVGADDEAFLKQVPFTI